MNNHMIKNIFLFFALAIFLTACNSNGSKSITVKKSANEKEFETEIRKLVKGEKDINSIEKDGFAILWWAVSGNYVDATKMLLEKGANPNITPNNKATWTVLFETTKESFFGNMPSQRQKVNRSKIIAELLIKHGADVNFSNSIGETPLHKAAQHGRIDLCSLFIRNEARVNATDILGNTPLHKAAEKGYWKAVQILLENGAQIDLRRKQGETALNLGEKRKEESSYLQIRKKNKDYCPDADYDKTISILKEHKEKR